MKRLTLAVFALAVISGFGYWQLSNHAAAQFGGNGFSGEEPPHRMEHHRLEAHFAEAKQKQSHLLEAAENLRRAGKPDLAEQLQHEAEEIERHLQQLHEREREHHPHEALEPIVHELHGLREEVHELREQINELREMIEQAIEEHEEEAEHDGERVGINLFELEPEANANEVKLWVKQLGEDQSNVASGRVRVQGKIEVKKGDADNVQVFVFDQDDLEAGDFLKELHLDDLKLESNGNATNLGDVIQQALEGITGKKETE